MEWITDVSVGQCICITTLYNSRRHCLSGKTQPAQLDRHWPGVSSHPCYRLRTYLYPLKDRFLTLQSLSEGYYMERGSKFHAYAYPVQTEDEVHGILQALKKDHPKARHFCSALRLYPDASLERSNDDGEPSGSAGKPILGQLIKNDLTNVFVVVVRYFGGTKLGIPGLIEAYKTSTADSIHAGTTIERNVVSLVAVNLTFESYSPFLNFCKQQGFPVFQESFDNRVSLTIGFRKSEVKELLQEALKEYSKMDFKVLEDYTSYLDFQIQFLDQDQIL